MELVKRKRTGCTECRRKKAKCDEKKPVCSRCLKFPRFCSYELNFVSASIRTTPDDRLKPSRLAQPSSTPGLSTHRMQLFPMLDSDMKRFHLDHFIANTAIIYFPLQPVTVLRLIIPLAEASPSMLEALIAASCSHFSRLKGCQHSYAAGINATVQCLHKLRKAITSSRTKDENAGLLPSSLMLATTSLCAKDTAAFRNHLNGALHLIDRDDEPDHNNPLWLLSSGWVVHLILMDRLSRCPSLKSRDRSYPQWTHLLQNLPDSIQIERITGFSSQLLILVNQICDLSDAKAIASNYHTCLGDTMQHQVSSRPGIWFQAQLLESRLVQLKNQHSPPSGDGNIQTGVRSSQQIFTNAALLCLYRRIYELPKEDPKIQTAVATIVHSIQQTDKFSQANIPLLWPLLSAGCESVTESHRGFIADRMLAMAKHGLGNCLHVLKFMEDYWARGAGVRWDLFAEGEGLDLVLY